MCVCVVRYGSKTNKTNEKTELEEERFGKKKEKKRKEISKKNPAPKFFYFIFFLIFFSLSFKLPDRCYAMYLRMDLHPSNNFFLLRKSSPPLPSLWALFTFVFFYTTLVHPLRHTPFPATHDTSVHSWELSTDRVLRAGIPAKILLPSGPPTAQWSDPK